MVSVFEADCSWAYVFYCRYMGIYSNCCMFCMWAHSSYRFDNRTESVFCESMWRNIDCRLMLLSLRKCKRGWLLFWWTMTLLLLYVVCIFQFKRCNCSLTAICVSIVSMVSKPNQRNIQYLYTYALPVCII